MLPTEQTERRGRVVQEQCLEHAIRDEAGEPREEEPEADLFPEHPPVTAEVVRHVGPRLGGNEPAAERQRALGRVMLMPGGGGARVLAGFLFELARDEEAEQNRHEDDEDGAAEELSECETPAEQNPEH